MAWSAFTPFSAVAGGALIGLAATILWLGLGRIAGISGIVGGLVPAQAGDVSWRVAFLAGLLVVGVGASLWWPQAVASSPLRGPVVMLFAGVVVGFGTRLGNGCTAGHGVCGLSRGSPRSLVATLTFMAAGILTASLVRVFFGGAL
jgi:uncharacterized membrane protein YedE/YeeE